MSNIRKRFRAMRHSFIRWWRIYGLVRFVQDNPYTAFLGRRLFLYLPFLLPHDKSYFGFAHLVHEGDGLFLDVGANDGISALGFRHVHSDYRILSIEPNMCHEAHLKNLKKRHLKRFEYQLVGAGNKRGKMTLYIPVLNGVPLYSEASLNKEYSWNSTNERQLFGKEKNIVILEHTVDIVPVDELNLNPDIVKIDTEGHDYEVLLGMKATIARCKPVILIEYLPQEHDVLKDYFKSFGYEFFLYDHVSDKFFPLDRLQQDQRDKRLRLKQNVFCVPIQKAVHLPTGHS